MRRIFQNLKSGVSLGGAIGLVAMFTTAYLSGKGVHASMEAAQIAEWMKLFIAATATLFLTSTAFLLWTKVGYLTKEVNLRRGLGFSGGALRRTLWLRGFAGIGATLVMIGSISTATIALVHLTHGREVQELLNRQVFAEVILPAEAMSVAFASVAATSARAERMAAQRSEEERLNGNTCAPDRFTKAGTGPVETTRANHADLAKGFAASARKLNADVEKQVAALASAADQTAANRSVRALRYIRQSTELIALRDEAAALASGYGGAGFGEIACTDLPMAARFQQIVDDIDALPNLPLDPPLRRDATIFDTVLAIKTIVTDDASARRVGLFPEMLVPFVMLAGLIDMVCALGALFHGMHKFNGLRQPERLSHNRIVWLLSAFFFRFPVANANGKTRSSEQAFVLVPVDGCPDRKRDIEFLVDHFGLQPDINRQSMTLHDIDPRYADWAERLRFVSKQAHRYTVYPVRGQIVFEEILALRRSARLALGFDHVNDPKYPLKPEHSGEMARTGT